MNREELVKLIKRKKNFLCIGLDSDIAKLPPCVLNTEDPVFEFNKAIIDATLPYAVAYKPNLAFYEANGVKGMISLQKTMAYLNERKDECFTIADAKRGDIGNTSQQYAKAYLSKEGDFNFDAMTVAPYMGEDSVTPFIYDDKWVVLLALTSNAGASDFQLKLQRSGRPFYETVIRTAQKWGTKDNMMFVCGATQAEMFTRIRKLAPDHFLLVPGVGTQGGNLMKVIEYGINDECGLLINSSRGIIFADNSENFADAAAEQAYGLGLIMYGCF
jgi:orotidine-5'-phosphate decarboxylase